MIIQRRILRLGSNLRIDELTVNSHFACHMMYIKHGFAFLECREYCKSKCFNLGTREAQLLQRVSEADQRKASLATLHCAELRGEMTDCITRIDKVL